ncbi:MAG: ATP-binding protein [Crinalium sp.]
MELGHIFLAYMAHGHCYLWNPWLTSVHVISDAGTALAYFSISAYLALVAYKNESLSKIKVLLFIYGAFIVLCGISHLLAVIEIWKPIYWVSGVEKTAMALTSIYAAFITPPTVRGALSLAKKQARAESLLRESEGRFQAFMDNIPMNIWIKDADLRIIYANSRLKKYFKEAQPLGKKDEEWLPPNIAIETRKNDLKALDTGMPVEAIEEVPFVTEDGVEIRTWEVYKFVIETPVDRLVGGCGIDITERLKIVDELQRSNTDLEQFAYAVSHDLQQPLRTISGFSTQLQTRLLASNILDSESESFLMRIIRATDRMKLLINDLLVYSRINQAQNYELVDVEEVVKDVLENLDELITATNTQVITTPLPKINGDRTQINQLFQNLVENAIKYRSPDRDCIVKITSTKVSQRTRFRVIDLITYSVSDNGVGIEREFHEVIFNVFQRLHGSEITGTGMGLAVCKRIVEAHEGAIGVISEVGVGSTFWFTLRD